MGEAATWTPISPDRPFQRRKVISFERQRKDQSDKGSRYAVRPVVYVPLTILLMLAFGFACYWALGGSMIGTLAGIMIAPVAMVALIVVNRFIEWFFP